MLKYPAEDPDPAIDAVIAVVPGCAAVITLVAAFSVATDAVATAYVSVQSNCCSSAPASLRSAGHRHSLLAKDRWRAELKLLAVR